MKYIKVSEAADKWGISSRRVRLLCQDNRIEGVIRKGNLYMIPEDAPKPIDGRSLRAMKLPIEFAPLFLRIDAKKAELDRRRPLTQGELSRFYEEFMIEFTYNSNAIEGNTLTLHETALVLEGITIDQKPLKEHLEAIGHRDAFLYVVQLVKDKAKVTEITIKQIHSLVLIDKPQDRGVYRRVPVKIMGAVHEPPQPYLIEPLMDNLVKSLEENKKTIHIIERAARFHLEFEGIHPFIDGNGRTGRLILNFELMQHGYLPIDVKFTDRRRYYAAFDSYFSNKDAGPMIKLIAEYVEDRLDEYLAILS